MAGIEPLGREELADALVGLAGWSVEAGRLHRSFRFADFVEAFGFMARVALAAERRDHHPDWSNSYATVVVDLATHEAGGITSRDIELARVIDELATGALG